MITFSVKSEIPRDPRASLEGRRVTCWAVGVRKEGGDVGNAAQQQRAVLGTLFSGERDDHVVLVPHMEGVVGKWVWWRVVGGRSLLVAFLFQVFIPSWTQQTF